MSLSEQRAFVIMAGLIAGLLIGPLFTIYLIG